MIWILWMPLFWAQADQLVQATPMTAKQAVEIGLANNFDVQLARIDAEVAETNVGLAKADRLPTVDATASIGISNEQQSTNSPFAFGDSNSRNFAAAVTLNWRLFDGYRLVASERRFLHLSELEQVNLRIQMESRVVAILSGYYDLVRLDALLNVAQESLTVSQERLEKLKLRRELGGVDQTEVLDATVAVNNDRAQLLERELDRKLAVQRLNLLLSREIETPIEVNDTLPEIDGVPQKQPLLSGILAENSQIRAARVQRKVLNEDITIAKAAFLPKVDFRAGIDWSDSRLDPSGGEFDFGAIDTTTTNTSINLGVSFNIFDGRRKKVQLTTAEMAVKRQDLEIKALELSFSQMLSEKLRTLEQRLALRELETGNIKVAEDNLTLTQEQYRLGATSSLEFRDAQVNLVRARANLVNVRYLAYLAKLDIDQLRGQLVP
jgi:outer membrane protein TolC